MIVTNAHQLAMLDSRIDTLYTRLADLDQRRDLSKAQQGSARSVLLWRAILLTRRRDGLPGLKELAARTLAHLAEVARRMIPLTSGTPALVRLPPAPPKP